MLCDYEFCAAVGVRYVRTRGHQALTSVGCRIGEDSEEFEVKGQSHRKDRLGSTCERFVSVLGRPPGTLTFLGYSYTWRRRH
jgi:hypothetical protein